MRRFARRPLHRPGRWIRRRAGPGRGRSSPAPETAPAQALALVAARRPLPRRGRRGASGLSEPRSWRGRWPPRATALRRSRAPARGQRLVHARGGATSPTGSTGRSTPRARRSLDAHLAQLPALRGARAAADPGPERAGRPVSAASRPRTSEPAALTVVEPVEPARAGGRTQSLAGIVAATAGAAERCGGAAVLAAIAFALVALLGALAKDPPRPRGIPASHASWSPGSSATTATGRRQRSPASLTRRSPLASVAAPTVPAAS